MPNVGEYDNEKDWMGACVPMRIDEGDEQPQAVAVCMQMWRDKDKGKSVDLDERLMAVREMFQNQFPSRQQSEPVMVEDLWIERVLDDAVIVRAGKDLYRAPYTKKKDQITFAPRAEWERVKIDYVPAKATNALKAVEQTDDLLWVGNYIVLFNVRDGEGAFSKHKNPDGTLGEYFTPDTQLESSYTKSGRVYLDWEHRQDDSEDAPGNDDEVLGYVDWSTAKADEQGVWVKRALYRHREYMKHLEELIGAGVIGTSSEAIGKKVRKSADGEIVRWPIHRDTLTVTPMEWRNKSENVVAALKGLAEYVPAIKSALHLATPEPEAAPEAGQPAAAAVKEEARSIAEALCLVPPAVIVPGKFTAGFIATPTEDNMSERETPVVDVAAITKQAAEDAIKAYRLELAKEPATNSGLVVTDDEADRAAKGNPFKSFGELLMAAKEAAINPTGVDKRLLPVRSEDGFDVGAAMGKDFVGSLYGTAAARKGWAVKQTDLSEGLGSHGGFLVGTDQNLGILARVYNVGQLLQRVDMMQVSAGSNGVTLNFENEVSRATGARRGGIRAYWVAEGGGKTHSHPEFRQIAMRLIKCVALIYSTDELLQDATALESWIMANLPEEIRFTVEDAIINGTGAGQPLGILGGPGLVTQGIEVGQLNTTFVSQNAINMWSRRWLGARDYVWLVHQTVVPQLMQMGLAVGVGGMLTYMPPGGLSGVPYGTLFGAPVIESEYCQTLGTVGDVILVSLKEYQMIEKGGMQSASSIHLAFLTDETIFRFVYRVQGMPKWNSALTPAHGGITTSPYVVLAGRP